MLPYEKLKELGLERRKCKICGKHFWSLKEREYCADHETYSFINNPVGKRLNYFEVWEDFKKFFEKRGYLPVKRYPVVCRWRDDLDFVIASIVCFQPWVTKGYIDPPSKKLVIPQFCLRFNDLGNVGFTGRHYTGFVMIGQHAFVKPEEYNTNEYFEDLLEWFLHLGIPLEEFVFHEDKWEGGGNAGYSLEFFVRGLEVANQVYMTYEVVNGEWKEMDKIRVLDMGMGQERIAWLLNGTPTSYDIVFPNTIRFLFKNLREEVDFEKVKEIAPYMSTFNFEEKTLKDFIKELNEKFKEDVSKIVYTLGAVYSIADHARTLLIAISDGCLPSNIGGGYNLRLVLRRMYDFIKKYTLIEDVGKIFEKILEDWYEKELRENLDEVVDIVNYEIKKYEETRKKAQKILEKIEIEKIDAKKLFELYTAHGITIELIKEKYPDFEPPHDFYKLLEEHRKISKKEKVKKEIDVDVKGFPETYKAFYEDWRKYYDFATYLGKVKEFLIFDKTIFYPLKGGQKYDQGWIFNLKYLEELDPEFVKENLNLPDYVKEIVVKYCKGQKRDKELLEKSYVFILEVYEKEKVILHRADKNIDWEKTDVLMVIDKKRREILTRHHTATHILTGVLRKIYGKHVWQAGAEKDIDKARLDVTHHKLPTKEEIRKIEMEVNKIILEGRKIKKYWLRRDEAEKRFGFTIYQGGFIPEINLRIVEIEGLDVEACSGTHLDNTSEVGLFKIIRVERIADGVIRFEFVAGEKALEYIEKESEIIEKLMSILNTDKEHLIQVAEKISKEREEYRNKLNMLIEEIIKKNIKDKKLRLELPLTVNDVLQFIMKYQKDIEECEIRCKDGLITTKQIEGRRIGKFYVKF